MSKMETSRTQQMQSGGMVEYKQTKRQSAYKPAVNLKQIFINRTSMGSNLGNTVLSRTSRTSFGSNLVGLPSGTYTNLSHGGVENMKHTRELEKKEMQSLNMRLADFIEKVRFLTAENSRLQDLLNKRKVDFNIEPMKEMYEAEIAETRKLFDEVNSENGNLRIKLEATEDELDDLRKRLQKSEDYNERLQCQIDHLNDDIAARINEMEILRRKTEDVEKQNLHWKDKYNHVDSLLQGARIDLQNETIQRLAECNRAQALEEELTFLKSITDAQIEEYKAMLAAKPETGARDYWKSELSKCVSEIQNEYDQKLDALSADMQQKYESQVTEIRLGQTKNSAESIQTSEENRRLKGLLHDKDARVRDLENQILILKAKIDSLIIELDEYKTDLDKEKNLHISEVQKLTCELEAVIQQLQELMNAKMGLELEICAYRKLLEGEENRLSMSHITENVGGFRSDSGDLLANALIGTEMSQSSYSASSSLQQQTGQIETSVGKVIIQRSAKGSIGISEVDNAGKYIMIENTKVPSYPRSSQNLSHWTIKQTSTAPGSRKELSFNFPPDYILPDGTSVKVWGNNFAGQRGQKDLHAEHLQAWFGYSQGSTISLHDNTGIEKSTFVVRFKNS